MMTKKTIAARVAGALALVLALGGLTVGSDSAANAAGAQMQSITWEYTYPPDDGTHTTALQYSPQDTAYSAMKRGCEASGHAAPPQGASDLEKVIGELDPGFLGVATDAGRYEVARFTLWRDPEFVRQVCAGAAISRPGH